MNIFNTGEFSHYPGCKGDVDNCSACALTTPTMIDGKKGINYSAWPLSYLRNNRDIPQKLMIYLKVELNSDNSAYVNNLKAHLYLDFVNNFLTLEKFAAHYRLELSEAEKIIITGRVEHEKQVEKYKKEKNHV